MAPQHPPQRLPYSASINASTQDTNSATIPYDRIHPNSRSGDSDPLEQASNRTGGSKRPRLPFKPFRYTKEGRWDEMCVEPQELEPVPSSQALQNGNVANHQATVTTQGLHGIRRFTRRILPLQNSSSVSSSSTIPVEESSLPIPRPRLRFKPLASHIHKDPQTFSEMGPTTRHQTDSLSGRLTYHEQDSRRSTATQGYGMSKTDPVRLANQLFQINANSFSVHPPPRNDYQLQHHGDFGTRQKDPQLTPISSSSFVSTDHLLDTSSTIRGDRFGYSTRQPTSAFSDQVSSTPVELIPIQTLFTDYSGHETGTTLVDDRTQQMEWTAFGMPTAPHPGIYRCLPNGLWYSVGRPAHPRYVVNQGTEFTHQCQGTFGCVQTFSTCSCPAIPSSPALYGQHCGNSQHSPLRGHQVGRPERDSNENMGSLLSELHSLVDTLRAISLQPSRRTIESTKTTERMDIASDDLPTSEQPVGPAPPRPVCISSKSPTPTICHMELPSSGSLDKCLQPTLAPPTGPSISRPTLELDPSNTSPTPEVPPASDSDHAQLASCSLVSIGPPDHSDLTAHVDSIRPRLKRGRSSSPEEPILGTSSLEPPLKRTTRSALSEAAADVISFSPASNKAAHHRWNNFQQWCEIREEDPFVPSATLLVNYLAEQHTLKKWSYNTVKNYAFYISAQYDDTDTKSIRQDEVFSNFLKGLGNANFQPLRLWNYDIQPILDYIIALGDNDQLSIIDLTRKTAWLLSMAGYLRPSDLERTDINSSHLLPGQTLHLVVHGPKEKRQGSRISKSITIHSHQNPLLCPVAAYHCYLHRQASSPCIVNHPINPRIQYNALFRYIDDPHTALGSERISKLVYSIMAHIGKSPEAPLPKARALGSTLAAQAGISVDDIVAHGNWSSKELFEHFYRISATTGTNFTQATLNEQQRTSSSKCNIM